MTRSETLLVQVAGSHVHHYIEGRFHIPHSPDTTLNLGLTPLVLREPVRADEAGCVIEARNLPGFDGSSRCEIVSHIKGHLLTPIGCHGGDRLGIFINVSSSTSVDIIRSALKDGERETGCGPLKSFERGKFHVSCSKRFRYGHEGENTGSDCLQNGKYLIGSIVKYTCNAHYIIMGSAARRCAENGNWTGRDPSCVADCGTRNMTHPMPLSVGGTASYLGEWPWQAAIYDTEAKGVICGGALIRERWVLTAGHCITYQNTLRERGPSDFLVYLGKHRRNGSEDDGDVQIRRVSRIILRRGFNLQNYDADIALMQLTEEAELTARVQLICLPTSEVDLDEKKGMVASWGYNESDMLADELMKVELPVIPNDKCRQETSRHTGEPLPDLTWNMFCADYENQSVCNGDSGSPMVSLDPTETRWEAVGIVSNFFVGGQSCSAKLPGRYGVFTKIARFTAWIRTEVCGGDDIGGLHVPWSVCPISTPMSEVANRSPSGTFECQPLPTEASEADEE
ncbi:unnamed protein product [Darwinula stevensoni]|uniref:Limulus clotting factor C n=1 Tax=Darwinula stevensoni TaxID=69355 RepID=A0A7R9A337_9CRUS|nr:unnamed protein product [Darwinula stevensoni]CAG0886995.1 unnamed protein product [Darwinula stevensoni]